jgi:hypothetical protein
MKITMILSAVMLSTFASLANACPFNPKAAYTEVTVPCQGSQQDYSQAFVNQRIDNGGECRVEPEYGSKLLVVGSNLVLVRGQENQVLGQVRNGLESAKLFYCYQTDASGDYYSNWQPVTLKN